MRQCNRVLRDVASKLNVFVKNVAGNSGTVTQKFLRGFWKGLLARQSVLLSEISRGNNTEISLKKQIERFSNRLASFSYNDILVNYHRVIKSEINHRTIFCVDNTDIIKPYGQEFENLGQVRDGSTGETEKGYDVVNIVALSSKHKQPIPLYSQLISSTDINYVSHNDETQKALTCINNSFGNVGIKVFDRGYDDSNLMRFLIYNNEKFIIRCKKNRVVLHNNKSIDITDITKEPASAIQSHFNKGKKKWLLTFKKYSVIISEMPLSLIVVTGFSEPMYLLTNLELDKEFETTVVKVYTLRWKVEEKFRFEKDVFDLENFRVRSMKAMRNIVMLTSMLVGFIAIICEHQTSKLFKRLLACSQTLPQKIKNNHLYFYSIARAISDLLRAHPIFSSA